MDDETKQIAAVCICIFLCTTSVATAITVSQFSPWPKAIDRCANSPAIISTQFCIEAIKADRVQ